MAYEKLMGRPHPSIRKHRLSKVDEHQQRPRTLRRSPSPRPRTRRSPSPPPTSNSMSHEDEDDDEGSRYILHIRYTLE